MSSEEAGLNLYEHTLRDAAATSKSTSSVMWVAMLLQESASIGQPITTFIFRPNLVHIKI